ncbi:MAG: hypothetical protein EU548_06050, partial [Promethearchaeota archaeon]
TEKVSIEYQYETNYLLESSHPYELNQTINWTISYPHAIGLTIHFKSFNLNYGDFLYIYDSKGNMIDILPGFGMPIEDYWTIIGTGNNITIELYSDEVGAGYGFTIDKIGIVSNISCSLINGTVYDGIWEGVIPNQDYGKEIFITLNTWDNSGNNLSQSIGTYTVKDNEAPQIIQCNLSDTQPTPNDEVNITINVQEEGSGIKNVTLYISQDGGFIWYNMSFYNISNDIWICTIPKQPDNTVLKYYIVIYDENGNYIRDPNTNFSSLTFEYPSEEPFTLNILILIIILAVVIGVSIFLFHLYNNSKKEIKLKVESKNRSKSKYKTK